jgi:hypothetical protein
VLQFLKSFGKNPASDRRKATARRPRARLDLQPLEDLLVPTLTVTSALDPLSLTMGTLR